jgi:hypothetical protein
VFGLGYSDIAGGFAASIGVIGLVSYLFYRLAFEQTDKLLSQIPI